jgi:pimeloyl-ACP methyl ester carboxylesterase
MIKLTSVSSKVKTDNHLILIPGGPGLSSCTIRDFDILKNRFHLHYVDFPGTNGNPYLGKNSFDELSDMLLDEVKEIDGNLYFLGHSYGGLFAVDMAIQTACSGIICVATPFSKRSFDGASRNYNNNKTEALEERKKRWNESPNDQTFREWLEIYDGLYFAPHSIEKGRQLMKNDAVSAQFFLDNRSDGNGKESLLTAIAKWKGKKLFIAGENDGLLSVHDLRQDAAQGRFEFISIKNANHFVMVDQAEVTATLIEGLFKEL